MTPRSPFSARIRRAALALAPALALALSPATQAASSLSAAEAFFDDDPGPGVGTPLATLDGADPSATLERLMGNPEVTELEPGVHSVSLRLRDADGAWSAPLTQSFVVLEGDTGEVGGGPRMLRAEAFIDTDPGVGNATPITLPVDGTSDEALETLLGNLPLNGLDDGVHRVFVRTRDLAGNWSTAIGQSFYLDPWSDREQTANRLVAARAWFDGDPETVETFALAIDGGTVSAPLGRIQGMAAMADLAPGWHVISLSLQDGTGGWSPPLAQSFYLALEQIDPSAPSRRLVAAQVRIDDDGYQAVAAADGAFDGMVEAIDVEVPVSQDYHRVRVRFLDDTGRWSDPDFAPIDPLLDNDGNGLLDSWELAWFGAIGQDPDADPDGDTLTNRDELRDGTNPLVSELIQTPSLSGHVRDADGQGVPHVLLCLDAAPVCSVRTDAYGHYVLTSDLSPGALTLRALPTTASGPLAFAPVAHQIDYQGEAIAGLDFQLAPIALTLTAPPADTELHPGDPLNLTWTSNAAADLNLSIDLRRDAAADLTAPNGSDWVRLAGTTPNDGAAQFTVPDGLTLADDWRLRLQVPDTDAIAESAPMSIAALPVPTPVTDLDVTLAGTALRLTWTPSTSPYAAGYRVYGNGGAGAIDYATPLALLTHPADGLNRPVLAAGDYRFAVHALNADGAEEPAGAEAGWLVPAFSIAPEPIAAIVPRAGEVELTGQLLDADGLPIANAELSIDISNQGVTRRYLAYTDADGRYAYRFQPLAAETGLFQVVVSGIRDGLRVEERLSFEVLGLELSPSSPTLTLPISEDQPLTGHFSLHIGNSGDRPLTGLTLTETDQAPSLGLALSALNDLPETLAPGEYLDLDYRLDVPAGPAPASDGLYRFTLGSAEGAEVSAQVRVQLRAANGVPVLEPLPLQAALAPGDWVQTELVIGNDGLADLDQVTLTLRDPDALPWIYLVNPSIDALPPGAEHAVVLDLAPPADLPLGRHVLTLDLHYDDATLPIEGLIELTSATTAEVAVQVDDDNAAWVAGAEVSLVAEQPSVDTVDGETREYFPVYSGGTGADGRLLLDAIPPGDYRWLVNSAGHVSAEGQVRVAVGVEPQALAITLEARVMDLRFDVVPTSIEDEYQVTLELTYVTNLTKPTLVGNPSPLALDLTEDIEYQAVLTVTNTSNSYPVDNLLVDASAPTFHGRLGLALPGGGRQMVIETLAPQASVEIPVTAWLRECADNSGGLYVGDIALTGSYEYASVEGELRPGTTRSEVPIWLRIYGNQCQPPDDPTEPPPTLAMPALSYLNDERDADPDDLRFLGNRTRAEVWGRGDGTFTPDGLWLDLVTSDGTLLAPNAAWLVDDAPLMGDGDGRSLDFYGLEPILEDLMGGSHRADLLNGRVALRLRGWWDTDPNTRRSYLAPVRVESIWPSEGGGGDERPPLCTNCKVPDLSWPNRPTLNEDGQVILQIPNRIGLERQAFDVQLALTATAAPLVDASVELLLQDSDDNDVRDSLFFVLATGADGLSETQAGTIEDAAAIDWQLIPSAEAGGELADGRQYQVAAVIRYGPADDRRELRTRTETLSVLPMPKLELDYGLPTTVMAGIPAGISVRVSNQGFGAAEALSIQAGQPVILDDDGIPVHFVLRKPDGDACPDPQGGALTQHIERLAAVGAPDGDDNSAECTWELIASRDGHFVAFDAALSHSDYSVGADAVTLDALITDARTDLQPALGGRIDFGGCGLAEGFEVRLEQEIDGVDRVIASYRDPADDADPGTSAPYYFQYQGANPNVERTPLQPGPYRWKLHLLGSDGTPRSLARNWLLPPTLNLLDDTPNPRYDYALAGDGGQDGDADGLPDCWEREWFGNADRHHGDDDYDRDGLTNVEEWQLGLNPANSDQNGDGIVDGEEHGLGLDPSDALDGIQPPTAAYFHGKLDPALPTVVLVHGLQSSCKREAEDEAPNCTEAPDPNAMWSGSAPRGAATLIQDQLGGPGNVNVVQYIWEGAFHSTSIPMRNGYKTARTHIPQASRRLARLLFEGLGQTDYDQDIHIIGHSLGTAVSAYSIRYYLEQHPDYAGTIQFTALDRPDRVEKIPGSSEDGLNRWAAPVAGVAGVVVYEVMEQMADMACDVSPDPSVTQLICNGLVDIVDQLAKPIETAVLNTGLEQVVEASTWRDGQRKVGFNRDFFAIVLDNAFQQGADLRLENYYAWDDLSLSDDDPIGLLRTGVGAPANRHPMGEVYNHALFDPYYVGRSFFPEEEQAGFVNNNHSAVTQWYRWTIDPDSSVFGDPSCPGGALWMRAEWDIDNPATEPPEHAYEEPLPYPFAWQASLDPCGDVGWKLSVLNHASPPASDADTAAVGRSAFPEGLAVMDPGSFEAFGDCRLGVDPDTGSTLISCREQPLPAPVTPQSLSLAAVADQPDAGSRVASATLSLAAADAADGTTSPLMLIEIALSADAAFLDFEYRFADIGDGDFAALLLDREEVWKLSTDVDEPDVWTPTGPIPIAVEAGGSHELMLRLFGEGEANASVELRNLKVIEAVADAAQPPTADAGGDRIARTGAAVRLDGTGSTGVGTLNFHWQQTSGPSVDLSDAAGPSPAFTPSEPGIYAFELMVQDDQTDSDPATVQIEVRAAGDLDGDADLDADDYGRFITTFGRCTGATGFDPLADLDADGCITFVDYQHWMALYMGAR